MSPPSRDELVEALREAYKHLNNHNSDYHHLTPKEFLDKIKALIDASQDKETP